MDERLKGKDFINVAELAEIMGISNSYAYNLVKNEECPFTVIRLGVKRILIPVNSFCQWYESLMK